MDDADDTEFERWFSAVRHAPEAARDLTAAFDRFSENAIFDLLREIRQDVASTSSEGWDSSIW